MMDTQVSPVGRADLERLWMAIRNQTPIPGEGIFGPSSIGWKINRESALFLAAGRASLLQLAHPWVAAALDQHSNIRTAPVSRFHHTFRIVLTMVFGTLEQAVASSRYLYQLHTRIQGSIPAAMGAYPRGSSYQANELHALLWVYATLIESAVLAYGTAVAPLQPAEIETYYRESRAMAALFGIPPESLPENWRAFENYLGGMLGSDRLGANDLTRELAAGILHGQGARVHGFRIRIPGWYRALTTDWLPERLRQEFALPYGEREQRVAALARKVIPRCYRRLPAPLRFVGPYREAQARLAGRPVDSLTRISNRFWTGQPHTMFWS